MQIKLVSFRFEIQKPILDQFYTAIVMVNCFQSASITKEKEKIDIKVHKYFKEGKDRRISTTIRRGADNPPNYVDF